MKIAICLAACLFLLHTSQCFAGEASFDGGNFTANWTYNQHTDTVRVQLEVRTLGWVGFGFATVAPNAMKDYDVIVAGVKNGQGYINDFYTGGESRPPVDAQQDYNLTAASEDGGKTMLTIERKRNTGDNKDLQLEAGVGVYLIWAYDTSQDGENPANFTYHSKRGSTPDKYVIVPTSLDTTTASPGIDKPTLRSQGARSGIGALAFLTVTLSLLFINL